jgi:hypothetical protein
MTEPQLGEWLRANDPHTLDRSTVHPGETTGITDMTSIGTGPAELR